MQTKTQIPVELALLLAALLVLAAIGSVFFALILLLQGRWIGTLACWGGSAACIALAAWVVVDSQAKEQ